MPTSKLNFTVNVPQTTLPYTVSQFRVGSSFNALLEDVILPSAFTYTSVPYSASVQANKYHIIISITEDTSAYYLNMDYRYSTSSGTMVAPAGSYYFYHSFDSLPSGITSLTQCLAFSTGDAPVLLGGFIDEDTISSVSNVSYLKSSVIPKNLVNIPLPNPS